MSLLRGVARALLSGHRSVSVEGVRYRERSGEPLHRALSSRGSGLKEYDVEFPNAAPLRIRCTHGRPYADLVGSQVTAPYVLADAVIRPGMRVLDVRCSTGSGAGRIASRVGPSGAVVALDPDHESIRFARRRYRDGNASFEIGTDRSLSGELDESFDAIVAVNSLRAAEDESVDLTELWRVLATGGPMLIVQPLQPDSRAGEHDPTGPLRTTTPELRRFLDGLEPAPGIEPTDSGEFAALIARKPIASPPSARRPSADRPDTYPPMR